MKPILTLLFTVFFGTLSFAQNTDKVLARLTYHFSHIQDTTQKDKPYTETMLLSIGKNASLYASADGLNQTMIRNKRLLETAKNIDPGLISIQLDRTSADINSTVYYFFVKENKFITKERVFNTYLIEEVAPKINWTLTSDTANFSGIRCQKALAYFKGRNWIAWFAPSLPFQSGPWKLNGLPGLILTAYDEKKEVQFQFGGMENAIANGTDAPLSGPKVIDQDVDLLRDSEISLPKNAIRTTQKAIDKLKSSRDKDPQGFIDAQRDVSNSTHYVKAQRKATIDPPKKQLVNNPIELPEIKN